jgi:DNA-binding transcriptional MocR family regulator
VLDLAHAAPPAPPEVGAAYAAALADLPRHLPGHGYAPHGLPELRARIADRFTARGLPTTPEQVLVTGGALHGVAVALQALTRPGDGVLLEDPTYPNVLDAVRQRGTTPVPVPVDAADPDGAVRGLTRAALQARPAAAYLVPDFANPSGLLLDEAARRGWQWASSRPAPSRWSTRRWSSWGWTPPRPCRSPPSRRRTPS